MALVLLAQPLRLWRGFKNVAKVVRGRDPAAFTEVGVGVVDAALVKCLAVSIEDDYFRGNLRTQVMSFA